MFEVMEGHISLTLNDEDAIAGVRRVREEVKANLAKINREKATVKVTADLRDLKTSLKEAEAAVKASQARIKAMEKERTALSGAHKGALTKKINAEKKALDLLRKEETHRRTLVKTTNDQVEALKKVNKEEAFNARSLKVREDGEKKILAIKQKSVRESEKAERALEREAAQTERALKAEAQRPAQIARLQREYDRAFQKSQRLEKRRKTLGGRLREASSPVVHQRVEMDQAHVIMEMESLRAKLEAIGAKPIEIKTKAEGENILSKLGGLGDIGTRIGPFSGTLAQFAKAALFLGPILTGLVGTVGALAGAIGTGLTGALGIAGAGAIGFGATFGGVFLALKPIATQFKEINKASNAYHTQVHKTGAESDKAKTKLQELNHVMGDLSPHAKQAFIELGGLNSRWKELTAPSRKSGMEAMADGVNTLSQSMPMLARNTNTATKALSDGVRNWMKGLRSGEGQSVINTIMGNTSSAIPALMEALGHLGAALGRVTASFSRSFKPLLTDFDHWTEGIDNATKNTDKLDGGVDKLVDSFRDVLGVTMAFGRVIKEMASAAMGPGGNLMDDMANSLNDLAQNIHDNPDPLKNFFGDSIQTTKALYDVLLPLSKLFIEFSTILRPATSAVLSLVGPLAELVHTVTAFGPMKLLLQAWATTWLLKRGTAAVVGLIAGSVNALAAAMTRLGAASAGAGLANFAGGLSGAGKAAGAASTAVAARSVLPVRNYGPGMPAAGVPVGAVGAGPRATAALATGAREAVTVGKMAKVGVALDALSVGLLGVSAPVAGIGLAAIGAAVGLHKLKTAADKRDREDAAIKKSTGVDVNDLQDQARQQAIAKARAQPGGTANLSSGDLTRVFEKNRAEYKKLAEDITRVNDLSARGSLIQKQLSGSFSTLANAQLSVESAEKQYAQAQKDSGKNSLEARLALQQLKDARLAEAGAAADWSRQATAASADVTKALQIAKKNYDDFRGKPGEELLKEKLIRAKDQFDALTLNIARAKEGLGIFTGKGAEELGRFSRQWAAIPNVKKLLIQVDDQASARKLAETAQRLKNLGHGSAASKILIDSKTPEEAIRRLEARLVAVQRRRFVKVDVDTKKPMADAGALLRVLGKIGGSKPHAKPVVEREQPMNAIAAMSKALDDLGKKHANPTVEISMKIADMPGFGLGGGGGGKSGDGTGLERAAKGKVREYASTHKQKLFDQFMGSGGLGSMPAKGSGLNAFNALAQRFGLAVGSGLRPGAITVSGNKSYHSMGRARDFPGSPANMMRFALFMSRTFGARLKELIYTPAGMNQIKNGQHATYPPAVAKGHLDHVHVAMAQGGQVKPGRFTSPTVLFAEEQGHPEYFISTNPRDKNRSRALLGQAAAEIGGVDPMAIAAFKTGGVSGGVGYTVKGVKPSLEQQSITKSAIAVAKALGATPKALKALLEAIFHESQAQNLKGGMGSSTGPLQLLASTAKGMGISARNPRAVFEAFLTKGFTGKGSAMKLAKNKDLTAAEIAHLVQGNGLGGSGVYAQRGGEADAAIRWYASQAGGGRGGKAAKIAEKATFGPSSNIANVLAGREAVLARATRSSNPQSVVDAIMGQGGDQSIPMTQRAARRRGAASLLSGAPSATSGQAANQLAAKLPTPGLMEALLTDDRVKGRRLKKIDKALAPGKKLTKTTRDRLLEERAGIVTDRSSGRTRRSELRKQAQDAEFEAQQQTKGGNKTFIDYNKAMAESTTTLDDDMAAAKAEQNYWSARYQWALAHKDAPGATEALNNFNTATGQIKTITDQTAADKKQAGTDFLAASTAVADLTPAMDDDLAASQMAATFWQNQLDVATAAGDMPGIAEAAGALKGANDQSKSIMDSIAQLPMNMHAAAAALTVSLADDVTSAQEAVDYWTGVYDSATGADKVAAGGSLAGAKSALKDATRNAEMLPLERDRALAALTDTVDDDKAATIKLRDYWQTQLDTATSSGDVAGQIEAAGNLKGLNDDIKGAEASVAAQMVLLSEARRDLYKSFGSNLITTLPTGMNFPTQAGPTTNARTTNVNVTNNFQTQPQDPHTWSKGVAWELQAAV